jgi:hypothetical protein
MKKIFTRIFVLSLVACAVISIGIFLFGKFDEIEIKMFLTVLSVGGYSLTALAAASLSEKSRDNIVTLAGIICSVMGFVVINWLIWDSFTSSELTWKAAFILMILSIALGQTCLLLHIKPKNDLVKLSLFGTILSISFVALMIINLVIGEFRYVDSGYLRLLGVLAVLDVLGTIATPILNKIL